MGQGYILDCPHCGEDQHLSAGRGMSGFATLEAMVSVFCDPAEQETLMRLAEERGVTDFVSERQIYRCPRCEVWHSDTNIIVSFKDGTVYEKLHRCPKCLKHISKKINIESDSVRVRDSVWDSYKYKCKCMSCGNGPLVDSGALILWD